MDKKEDILMVKPKEIKRLQIIEKVFKKEINQQEAAGCLNLSDRQIRRVVKRVREEGERGVIHRLRGCPSSHRIKNSKKNAIITIYKKEYDGFGPTLASEKMLERENIRVCDETLRLWLIKEGLWKIKQKNKKKKRSRRARKDRLGEMIQMDGSHHDWLEDRGPKLVLMGYIDDATGKVRGEFHEYEGTKPAMGSLKGYIKKDGIPKKIYLDKHATYKNNEKQRYKEWPFRDQEGLTQFSRACQELGIELIYANSPQAKGRVERLFKTLQDRLVKELRLEGAKTLKEANQVLRRYLPKFNKKFNVKARLSGDLHRPLRGLNLDEILSIQTEHVLRNDRTMVHQKQWYQVLDQTRAKKVIFHEYSNGRVAIKYGKSRLNYKLIEEKPERIYEIKKKKIRKYIIPEKSHPWRTNFKLSGSLRN